MERGALLKLIYLGCKVYYLFFMYFFFKSGLMATLRVESGRLFFCLDVCF